MTKQGIAKNLLAEKNCDSCGFNRVIQNCKKELHDNFTCENHWFFSEDLNDDGEYNG